MEYIVVRTVRLILLSLTALLLLQVPVWAQQTFTLEPYRQPVTITGFTYPLREMTVTSEVNGRCTAVLAEVGDTLADDGFLAEIDPTFIRLDIEANRIATERMARQLAQEEKSLARYTALRQKDSVSQAQFDEVSLSADLHRIGLKNLANEADRLKEQLARHTLTGPSGWQVIERHIDPGEVIQTGTPVAKLGDFRQLRVVLAVSYGELQLISALTPLKLSLPDLGRQVAASIFRVSPTFNPQTRKIGLELAIDGRQSDPALVLRGGMRAELRFAGNASPSTFVVPHSALISRYEAHWLSRPDGSRVQVLLQGVIDEGNKAVVAAESLSVGEPFLLEPEHSGN